MKLNKINELKFQQFNQNVVPVYWMTNIFYKKKEKLINYLNRYNIQTRECFYPINLQQCYKSLTKKQILFPKKSYNVSKKIYNEMISLPSSYNITKKELDYICKKIKFFFKK